MEYPPEPALGGEAFQLPHGGPETAVVPDGEDHAGPPAGSDHGHCIGCMERKRLLAKHVFAGLRRGDHLLAVQRVRRCKHDGAHRWIGQRICKLALWQYCGVDFTNEPDPIAALHRVD